MMTYVLIVMLRFDPYAAPVVQQEFKSKAACEAVVPLFGKRIIDAGQNTADWIVYCAPLK